MKRAVIFDFDGTIADSLPAVVPVFEELTRSDKKYSAKQIDSLRDLSIADLMRVLKVPKWKAPLLLFRGRYMIRSHMHGIAVHKGMVEVLQSLQTAGVPLYVLSSNSTDNVKKYLQWHNLSGYFLGVYGGASLLGKAPRLLKLLAKEKISTKGSWYVGDEMRDVSAARAVGLHIASVTWGYNTEAALAAKEPDLLVGTAEELLRGLEAAWKK